MISPIGSSNNSVNFKNNSDAEGKKLPYAKDTLLENNFANRARIGYDKFTNALTLYPAKGLKGNRNANFYEFLTLTLQINFLPR